LFNCLKIFHECLNCLFLNLKEVARLGSDYVERFGLVLQWSVNLVVFLACFKNWMWGFRLRHMMLLFIFILLLILAWLNIIGPIELSRRKLWIDLRMLSFTMFVLLCVRNREWRRLKERWLKWFLCHCWKYLRRIIALRYIAKHR